MRLEKLVTPLSRGTRALSTAGLKVIAPHPVPRLAVMDELEQRARAFLSQSPLRPDETAIIGAQHLLETTSTLFSALRNLGFEAYVTGKSYSTSPGVYEAMKGLGVHVWPGSKPERLGEYQAASEKDATAVIKELERNPRIKNIILCDDGGRFVERLPPYFRRKYKIAGVEQTRAGFYSKNVEMTRFPIVNVAQSATKLFVEPTFIAETSVEQISTITRQLDSRTCVVGIVGFGSIGKALAQKLIQDGFSVAIFDTDPTTYRDYPELKQIEVMRSIEQLFIHTNFIIGCTGLDITENFNPLTLNGHNRLIASVSSEDKEFKQLLKLIASQNPSLKVDPLSNIECYTNGGSILEILYGGFPVNFANTAVKPYSVPIHRIGLTRGLLFSGIMQAIEILGSGRKTSSENVMLDPGLQQQVVRVWHETTDKDEGFPHDMINHIVSDRNWVIEHSKGTLDTESSLIKTMGAPDMKTNPVKRIS